MHESTTDLLRELDDRGEAILTLLITRGEPRPPAVDLHGLGDSLAALETTIAEVRERIAGAEPVNGSGHPDRVVVPAHHHLVHHGPHHATPGHHATPAHPAARDDLATAIRAGGGRFEPQIVHAARLSKLPVALVCAVVEQESGFRNVFGHDRVANPVKSPAGGVLEVTRERYERYLHHRRLGHGNQGVGPMQLTWPGFQDRADAYGGCWRPGPNIRVGCEVLAEHIARLGTRAGIQAYNGAHGFAYADSVLALERKWRARLAGAHPAAAAGPRAFRLTHPPMRGEDVRGFQRALNRRLAALRVNEHVAEDGEFGPETRRAARQAAYALGAGSADWAHGITPDLQRLIETPSRRTPQQLARSRRRRGWLARLRKRENGPLRLRAYKEAKRLLDAHVRESGGNNRGKVVAEIILANHGVVGEAWCGDFIAWCYRKAGSKSVNRNWDAPRLYLPMSGLRRTRAPQKGDLVRYTFDHIGVFVAWCDAAGRPMAAKHATHLKAIEGNTGRVGAVSDSAGGGDGVYLKIRSRALARDFIHVAR
jgi:hypothetical protein